MQELRSEVLSGDLDLELTKKLALERRSQEQVRLEQGVHVRVDGLVSRPHLNGFEGELVASSRNGRWQVLVRGEGFLLRPANIFPSALELRVDRTQFAEEFEEELLALEQLTEHQREALAACVAADESACARDGMADKIGGDGGRGIGDFTRIVPSCDVHLRAPAGAGKTFVALHRLLGCLRASRAHCVLFVARSKSLATFAACWVARRAVRESSMREARALLRRMHVLFEPLEAGARRVRIGAQLVHIENLPPSFSAEPSSSPYALVVVDEAHHIYSSTRATAAVESFVGQGTRRFLLSDLSQSLGRQIAYPSPIRDVTLTEVVRCSKRIVAGAMAFQLGGEEKLLTKCQHNSVGPPLKSFIFDVDAEVGAAAQSAPVPHAADVSNATSDALDPSAKSSAKFSAKSSAVDADAGAPSPRFSAYAKQTLLAIAHARHTFPSLRLHNRVAIAVPDQAFRRSLLSALEPLASSEDAVRRVRFVDASTASSLLLTANEAAACGAVHDGEDGGGGDSGDGSDGDGDGDDGGFRGGGGLTAKEAAERSSRTVVVSEDCSPDASEDWLVCDCISELDGLERLVVIAVGLDAPIDGDAARAARGVGTGGGHGAHGGGGAEEGGCGVAGDGAESGVAEANCDGAASSAGHLACADGSAVGRSADAHSEALRTRSMLYRAVTRAQLMAMVVNEYVTGGWLEFLGHVRLRSDEPFDRDSELSRAESVAVEGVVRAEIAAKIEARAALCHVAPVADDVAAALLAASLLRLERAESSSADDAVAQAVDSWAALLQQSRAAVERAAAARQLQLPEAAVRELASKLGLALQKGEVANMELEVSRSIDKWVSQQESQALSAALDSAGASSAAAASGEHVRGACAEVAAAMCPEIGSSCDAAVRAAAKRAMERGAKRRVESGDSSLDAAKAAVEEWVQCSSAVEREVEDALQAEGALPLEASAVVALAAAAMLGVADGAAPSDAVQRSMSKLPAHFAKQRVRQALVDAATAQQDSSESAPDACMLSELEQWLLLHDMEAREHDVAELATSAVARWRQLELSAKLALRCGAAVAGVRLSCTDEQALLQEAARLAFYGSDAEAASKLTLERWMAHRHTQHELLAQLTSALEAEAELQRVMLSDGIKKKLIAKAEANVQRGDEIDAAVRAAIREWRQSFVRHQVLQTVWDPSANSARQSAGALRFMPFKQHGADSLEYEMLLCVFKHLHFTQLSTVALVCKKWLLCARDPSWKPDVLAYAWGSAQLTGLSRACAKPTLLPFSVEKQVKHICCAEDATLALTMDGQVFHWGRCWLRHEPASDAPRCLPELRDISAISCSPSGYYHNRRRSIGYCCAAVTRTGGLYTWGPNFSGALLHEERLVSRPTLVPLLRGGWAAAERVTHAACGLDFLAIALRASRCAPSEIDGATLGGVANGGQGEVLAGRSGAGACANGVSRVLSCGSFVFEPPHALKEWEELRDLSLRSLVAGSFHCCALSTRGELYTFGDTRGRDISNGNLLGHGDPEEGAAAVNWAEGPPEPALPRPPRRLQSAAMGPVTEVSCTTYATLALSVDGRAFSWGDSDGNALGHASRECHTPTLVPMPAGTRVAHGDLSYTNAAVATDDGRCFVWGGNSWDGGIAQGRNASGPTEIKWSGVPDCYQCSSVALSHQHGYLIFHKKP